MQRYDSYKDSGEQWLGEIPSHWEVRKAKYLWKETNERSEYGSEDLLSVSQYEGVRQSKDDSRSESLKGYKIVKNEDLVINIMLAWLGGLGVSNYEGIVSPAYCTYKLIDKQNPRFLHYLYRTPLYLAEFARRSTGIVPSRWRMYTDDFGQVLTLLPPLEEQKRMVEYLDVQTAQIDEAIAQQQKMIDLLNERKQIIINNAVTKGLNPDAPMKDSGVEWIGMIPEHWEVMPLKRVGSMSKGLTFTKADIVDEGYPAISYGQVHSKINTNTHIIEDLIRYVPKSFTKKCETSFAQQGDFIFADTSEDYDGCGNCVYNDTENGVYGGYHTIVLKTKFRNCKYIAYLCKTDIWRYQIRSRVSGVKVYSITQGILSQVGILFPPLSEQNRMVQYLDAQTAQIDEAIAQQQKMIDLLNERKQIIINDVVTGKVKV